MYLYEACLCRIFYVVLVEIERDGLQERQAGMLLSVKNEKVVPGRLSTR
jgi:hypothetical protein